MEKNCKQNIGDLQKGGNNVKSHVNLEKMSEIIIPLEYSWDWSADYERQTVLELSKTRKVIVFMHNDASFFLKHKKSYPRHKNVLFYQPRYFIPFSHKSINIEKLNFKISALIFRFLFLKNRRSILWVFSPEYLSLIKLLTNCVSIYDCVDYRFHLDKNLDKEIKKKERLLIKCVDYFFVNSQILAKTKRNIRKPDLIVVQGFNIKAFKHNYRKSKLEKKEILQTKKFVSNIPKPNLTYVGALSYRLDFKLLLDLIKKMPKVSFIFTDFVVPTYQEDRFIKTDELLKKLREADNTYFVPKTKYRSPVKEILKNADICMIPYNTKLLFNKYCYPMKVFEFFYLGKPVVSTDIVELRRFPKYVKISKNAKGWKNKINELFNKSWPNKYQKEEKKLSVSNSWKNKVNSITDYLVKQGEL